MKSINKILLWIPVIGFGLWISEYFSDLLYSQRENLILNGYTWGLYQGLVIGNIIAWRLVI